MKRPRTERQPEWLVVLVSLSSPCPNATEGNWTRHRQRQCHCQRGGVNARATSPRGVVSCFCLAATAATMKMASVRLVMHAGRETNLGVFSSTASVDFPASIAVTGIGTHYHHNHLIDCCSRLNRLESIEARRRGDKRDEGPIRSQ